MNEPLKGCPGVFTCRVKFPMCKPAILLTPKFAKALGNRSDAADDSKPECFAWCRVKESARKGKIKKGPRERE